MEINFGGKQMFRYLINLILYSLFSFIFRFQSKHFWRNISSTDIKDVFSVMLWCMDLLRCRRSANVCVSIGKLSNLEIFDECFLIPSESSLKKLQDDAKEENLSFPIQYSVEDLENTWKSFLEEKLLRYCDDDKLCSVSNTYQIFLSSTIISSISTYYFNLKVSSVLI